MPLISNKKPFSNRPQLASVGQLCLWALAIGCLLAGPAVVADSEQPVKARFWSGDMTPARVQHETEVIQLALDKSRKKYGDFVFEVNSELLSNQRVERAIHDGQMINLTSSPIWMINESQDDPLIVIPIPITRGLLGYRQCIVRRENLPKFSKIKTLADLRELTSGLVSTWTDVDIFDHSELKWQGAKSIEQLHYMLTRSRFDYLPLGSVEAEESLQNSLYRDELAIVPNLVIYYPLPVLVQVSINQPVLAERIEYGLRQAQADGSLDALFDKHYGAVVEKLSKQKARVIELENPYLPEYIEDKGPTILRK